MLTLIRSRGWTFIEGRLYWWGIGGILQKSYRPCALQPMRMSECLCLDRVACRKPWPACVGHIISGTWATTNSITTPSASICDLDHASPAEKLRHEHVYRSCLFVNPKLVSRASNATVAVNPKDQGWLEIIMLKQF